MSDIRINGVNPNNGIAGPAQPGQTGETNGVFDKVMDEVMGKLNQVQAEAQQAVSTLASGGDVTQAVIDMEKANMNFEVMVEVRNKLISAYEEIMRMQV